MTIDQSKSLLLQPAELIIDVTIEDDCWHALLANMDLPVYAITVFQYAFDFISLDIQAQHIEVSLVLTDDDSIQLLNKTYRHQDKPTNVLSFGQYDDQVQIQQATGGQPLMLGDIIIARQTLQNEAIQQSKSFKHHFIHILLHGFVHLLGYDHENDLDTQLFESIEIAVLDKLHIANPYQNNSFEGMHD